MAQILVNLREEASQSALENGVAGVGGLQSRELGYSSAALEFSFRTHAGPIIHIPTREKLLLAANTLTSGAAGIGYFPYTGFVSDTVQEMLDELAAAVAGAATLGGVGVAGRFAYWTGTDSLDDVPFLDVVSGKMQFNGDADVTLYRPGAGILATDAIFAALAIAANAGAFEGTLSADEDTILGTDYMFDNAKATGAALASILGTLNKNNANTRVFSGLQILPTLNPGGSNTSTTLNVFDLDTVNTALTGLTVRLMKIAFGGSDRLLLNSSGLLSLPGIGGLSVASDSQLMGSVWARQFFTAGSDLTQNAPSSGIGAHNFYGVYNRNTSGTLRHSHVSMLAELNAGGSNAGQTLDVLELGTTNTSLTGMTINLLRMLYGGVQIFKMSGLGTLTLAGPSGGTVALGVNVSSPETSLHISHMGSGTGKEHAALTMQSSVENPADPAVGQFREYLKGSLRVIQYNDGGTIRYKSLDLSGTGTTFTHSTTPP